MATTKVTTVAQRRLDGRGGRFLTSRKALGQLAARDEDFDPVVALGLHLASNVESLLPLRWRRMLENPFTFFRGSAFLMAQDLVRGPSSPWVVTSAGDAHLGNFGTYSSAERRIVFDLNDFDETFPAPFEWDVKRLTTSVVIAGVERGVRQEVDQMALAAIVAREYRHAMRRFAEEPRLEVWNSLLDVRAVMHDLKGVFSDAMRRRILDVLNHLQLRSDNELTRRHIVEGEPPQIIEEWPHFTHDEGPDSTGLTADHIAKVVEMYADTLMSDHAVLLDQFHVVDVARHIIGVGSVGTECWAALLCGRDYRDTFFLQIKEAHPSVLALAQGRIYDGDEAHRVVSGQRLMQAAVDPFLGHHRLDVSGVNRSFYVRRLYDHRAAVDISRLTPTMLEAYGRVCAWVLARAHARGGQAAQIAGYLGGSPRFDEAMATFAVAYRNLNAADFETSLAAVREGRITVTM